MKLTVPFAYRGEVLFPRSDTPKEEVFVETFDVEVPELSSGEIDEALRYRIGDAGRSIYLNERGFLQEAWGGGERVERLPASYVSPLPGEGLPLSHVILRHYPYGTPEYNAVWGWHSADKSRSGRDPAKVREWFRSDREETLTKVEVFYRGIVALDGFALLPCEEPKFVSPSLNLCTEDVSYSTAPGVPGDPLLRPVFNILDFEDAQVHAAAHEGWENRRNYEPGSIEILMPEAFTFDRGKHALQWAAADLCDTLAKDIMRLPEEAILNWIALRRLVTEMEDLDFDHAAVEIVDRCIPFAQSGKTRARIERMIGIWTDLAEIDPLGQIRSNHGLRPAM